MKSLKLLPFALILALFFSACELGGNGTNQSRVNRSKLFKIRLGDGVPLHLTLAIRWKVEDPDKFLERFVTYDTFHKMILEPRASELARQVSNQFLSVDSVFSSHRQHYIKSVRAILMEKLGEPGVKIEEVILADIEFPQTYTAAMEQEGLREQELKHIKEKNIIDVAQAEANRIKAEAEGKVAIREAQLEGDLQNIKANTEESRRRAEIARAETEKQVAKMTAEAEAKRLELLAETDVKKERDLQLLDLEKKRELEKMEIDKQRRLDDVGLERDIKMARLCQENPAYASYMVNKELASKVQIAVLPSDGNSQIFGSLLNQKMQKP